MIEEERVHVRIIEKARRVEAPDERWRTYSYEPTGNLRLEFPQAYAYNGRKTWKDGPQKRIEGHIGAFLRGAYHIAQFKKKNRQRREKTRRQQKKVKQQQKKIRRVGEPKKHVSTPWRSKLAGTGRPRSSAHTSARFRVVQRKNLCPRSVDGDSRNGSSGLRRMPTASIRWTDVSRSTLTDER